MQVKSETKSKRAMKKEISKTGKTIRLVTGLLLLVTLMIVNVQLGLNDGNASDMGLSGLNDGCVTEAGFFGLSTALFTPLAVATCAYGSCDGGCQPGTVCDGSGPFNCCLLVCDGSCTDCFNPGCNGSSIECGTISGGSTCYRDPW